MPRGTCTEEAGNNAEGDLHRGGGSTSNRAWDAWKMTLFHIRAEAMRAPTCT